MILQIGHWTLVGVPEMSTSQFLVFLNNSKG